MQNEQGISVVNELITDINGALVLLEERGRVYSIKTLQYHVQRGNVPAYVFDGTGLVRWSRDNPRHRGKEYIFLKSDINAMPLESKAGRKPREKQQGGGQETTQPTSTTALPEKTQQQLRDLMEWTEGTSLDKVLADAVEQVWQAVKIETFGDPEQTVTIKVSGPGAAKAEISLYYFRNHDLHHVTKDSSALSSEQQLSYDVALNYAKHGLMTPARETLERAFDQVVIEGPGYSQ